jgi:hypothetical protein
MSRGRVMRVGACGCVLLMWAGAAVAETPSTPPDTAVAAVPDTTGSIGNATPPSSELTPASGQTSVATASTSVALEADDCLTSESCIDQYLWSLYERTPKLDTIKLKEKLKVTVKRKGKLRTVTKTVIKLVDEDFTWKDPKAAERTGLSQMKYVIGGLDRTFKRTLFRALRAMDVAGFMPGITSAFRDDYRQGIASGNKASSDSSFHGGSRRGGYGHGLAVDLVSVKGATRAERWVSSDELWKWIDVHGREYGVGRPYLDRDPPHVGPIDGREYIVKRGGGGFRLAAAKSRLAHRHTRTARPAGTVATAKPAHGKAHQSDATAKARARKSTT